MSTSGSTLFRKISETRGSLESEISRHTQSALAVSRKSLVLLEQQAGMWASLAEIHLDLASDLPAEIARLVGRRKERLDKQKELVETSSGRIRELTDAHRDREAEMTVAQTRFDAHEQELAARLAADPEAVKLTALVNRLTTDVRNLAEKTDRIRKDCEDKASAYEDDELFAYLRRRGFGTDGYRSSGLVARLDHWVSRLCGYDRAAADYVQLQKIPGWHEENLARIRSELSRSTAALEILHKDTFKTLVPLKDALRQAGGRLDAAADDLARAHASVKEAQRTLADAASAQDEDLKVIRRTFAKTLERANLKDLEALAARTETKEDDRIVRNIAANRAELAALEEQSDGIAREVAVLKGRVSEIESIEGRFRRKNWHHSDHSFGLRGDVDGFLAGLVTGMVTSDSVWRSLESAHRDPAPSYRESVSPSSSPWDSGSSGSGGSYGSSGSSSSSGSDYSTGGGWGGSDSGSSGSDYSTGGGF